MPNQPRNKHRMIRFSDEDWAELGEAAEATGSDRSTVIRQLALWWLRRPGVKQPARREP